MKIVRERPCQRRHHRLVAPLYVNYKEEKRLLAKDWSVGGLAFTVEKDHLPQICERIDLTLTLPFQGYDITFETSAEVVRVGNDVNSIGCRFIELSERSKDLLSYFGEDLIRGKMGSVDDTICRIDVPVTPISTTPTTSHPIETPLSRWPIRTILMSAGYILLGLSVFITLGVIFYSNFVRLEVSSSVVSTELQTLKMPMDGFVQKVRYDAGQSVFAGDVIMHITDRKLESTIANTKIRVEAAERNISRIKQKRHIEEERLKLYQIVSRTDRGIAEARLSAAREALKSADAQLVRMSKLLKSGVVTKAQVEKAKQAQAQSESQVREQSLILEKATAMDSVSGQRHYNHKVFAADLDLQALELVEAIELLDVDVKKLQLLEQRKEDLLIRAPFDARIVKLYQSEATGVARNEPLILIERSDQVSVTAFLNQAEVMEVGLFDQASVFVPALDVRLAAQVVRIDRNSLMLNQLATDYTWKDEKERSAAVILQLDVSEEIRSFVSAGQPAVVIFKRRRSKGPISRIFSGSHLPDRLNNNLSKDSQLHEMEDAIGEQI